MGEINHGQCRNPLSSQVISNKKYLPKGFTKFIPLVVIPYQVRSYQTYPPLIIMGIPVPCRNPLSSQVISNATGNDGNSQDRA